MTPSPQRTLGLGFSAEATPLLQRLIESGLLAGGIRWPGDTISPADWLAERWPHCEAVVAVGACGLVVRLIAPLLACKSEDPAVVVIDPLGRVAIPLLGGHRAGAEALALRLAALLGGNAAITGSSGASGRLALDAFGEAWGWRRGGGDWSELMLAASRPGPGITPLQRCGSRLWRSLGAATAIPGLQNTIQPGAAGGPVEPQGESAEPAEGSGAPSPRLAPPCETPADQSRIHIDHRLGQGCHWHPPVLWLGVGCERDTSPALIERLVTQTLAEAGLAEEAVAGMASIDRKGDEAALLELAQRRGWPLRLFNPQELAAMPVPNPSAAVAREMGTASVAEASALLASAAAERTAMAMAPDTGGAPSVMDPSEASGEGAFSGPGAPAGAQGRSLEGETGRLLVEKRIGRAAEGERGAATLAVALSGRQWAPQRGELHLVGSGPGRLDLLSGDAREALARATAWVGYGPYLDLLEPLRRPDQLRRDGRLTEERARCLEAIDLARQGLRVALISSGDSGIYGMAGLALELWLALPAIERPAFSVHPGISALQLAAAKVGAPLMHDFCTISLSDRLTPWSVIERRLRAAAEGDFVVALYNPRSAGRDWQLERARALLLEHRPAGTPVALARQLGRSEERVELHTLEHLPVERVDMLTLVLIGNSTTRIEADRMVTPRGYPGASLA